MESKDKRRASIARTEPALKKAPTAIPASVAPPVEESISAAAPIALAAALAETAPEVPPEPVPAASPAAVALPVAATAAPELLDAWSAVGDCTAAFARALEAATIEVAGLARTGIDTATTAASKLLGATTLVDAVEINLGYARETFAAAVNGTAALSEIAAKAAAEASRPMWSSFRL